jgi:hypothetical protein
VVVPWRYSDSIINVSQSYSALAGAIWQLAFDVAFRYALVNGRPVNEVRAGLSFGFPLVNARPANTEMSSLGVQAHRRMNVSCV